ncbi:MAG: WG repeat-containing protein, partial [Oscillospiraceae bacterium]
MKRIMSAVLSVALVFGLAVMPVGAAGSAVKEVGKIAADAGYKPYYGGEVHGGRILVTNGKENTGSRFGYADITGKLVIPCQYKRATEFVEGAAAVLLEDGQYALIDADGKYIVQPGVYREISNNNGGELFLADRGYIDSTGKVIVAPEKQPGATYRYTSEYLGGQGYLQEGTRVSFIDENYKVTHAFDLPEGMWIMDGLAFRNNRNEVIRCDYAEVRDCPNNIAGKFGVIDKTGKLVVEEAYERVSVHPDGFAFVTESYDRDSTG